MVAHADMRRLAKLAGAVVNQVPEQPPARSPRYRETRSLRSSPGGGGVARAELLDKLNVEMQVMVAHLSLLVDGVADALHIAFQRDNEVNRPALAFAVRPALELAGQVTWLLDDKVDALQRVRRYVVWRLADLRAQRLLLRDFRTSEGLLYAAANELDATEDDLLAIIKAARWTAQPTAYRGAHTQAASLVGVDGKPERLPRLGELVRQVSTAPATYGLLSVTSHSQRFGVLQGLEVETSSGMGEDSARIGGFPLDTNLLIGLAVLSINIPTRLLGGWNGIDTRQLHSLSVQLMERSGPR